MNHSQRQLLAILCAKLRTQNAATEERYRAVGLSSLKLFPCNGDILKNLNLILTKPYVPELTAWPGAENSGSHRGLDYFFSIGN